MATNINICTKEWCNLVFEGKNKSYGAYELRQMSSKRHALAILLSISIFALGVSAPVLLKKIVPGMNKPNTEQTTIADIFIDKPDEQKLPDLPIPQVRRTIQFQPPVISDDPDETSAPPLIDVMLASNAAIGATTQDGTDTEVSEETFRPTEETPDPVPFVQQMPSYPGGDEARIQFLKDNLKYPSIASEMGISGRVTLQFIVDKHGKIDKIKILRGIGGGCDEEAVRVVSKMPNWNPGKQNGRCVPVIFTFPIVFTLQNQ